MANVNYVNPASFLPQTDWKPGGFLAGHLFANQERDYNQFRDLAQDSQRLGLQQQGAEFNDYMLSAPVRDAKRNLDISTYDAQAPIQRDLAGAQRANAQDIIKTQPSKTASTIFKNNQDRLNAVKDALGDGLNAVLSQNGENQLGAVAAWENLLPQLERLSGEPVPEQFKRLSLPEMKMLAQTLTADKQFRQKSSLQGQQIESNESIAVMRANAELEINRISATAKAGQLTSADLKLQSIKKLTELYQIVNKMSEAEASLKAYETVMAGNPEGRSAGAVRTNQENVATKLGVIDLLHAVDMPAQPPRRGFDPKVIYRRLVDGKWEYSRYNAAKNGFDVIELVAR